MKRIKRIRFRLQALLAALLHGWNLKPIAGGAPKEGEGGEEGGGEGGGEEGGEPAKPKEEEGGEQKPPEDQEPPWGSDENFDPKRAWKLIQDVRGDLDKVKSDRDAAQAKVKEHEDATKSDQEKLEERASGAEKGEKDAKLEAAKLRVALKKGLDETQAKRLVGETEEELEQDADELLESFKGEGGDEEGEKPRQRPTERLRPGAAPSADAGETDPAKLADEVGRSW